MKLTASSAAVVRVLCLACAGVLMLASCGDDDDGGTKTTVNVTLREFSVTPDQLSAPPGRITFNVTNGGTELHEFLVIKTNLAPDDLPTNPNGSYEEDGPGTELLDEIEEFEPGETEELTLQLGKGNYVLICNRVEIEDGEEEAHYSLGMFVGFTVE